MGYFSRLHLLLQASLLQRNFSTSVTSVPHSDKLHPTLREFTRDLAKSQPCFALPSSSVRILHEPKEFLSHLLEMIGSAKRRIFLSSLYIGGHDSRLLESVLNALRLHSNLHVYMHLDYNRCTRPEPSCTAELLIPLIREHPDRVHVRLFKSPKLKGILGKLIPRRFDEGWGTWHAKMYGADDEVIISGANLNESYFTDRQDRYIHLKAPAIAEYCFTFLETMKTSCFQLRDGPNDVGEEHASGRPYSLVWSNDSVHPEKIEVSSGVSLKKFQQSQRTNSFFEEKCGSDDVLIFPVIQSGQFGMREEEDSIRLLLSHLRTNPDQTTRPLLDLTSGYFSLYKPYQQLILQSVADCQIVVSSPSANGFYGSQGISGRIPEGYTFLEQRFWNEVVAAGRSWGHNRGIQLQEWQREGWTYHAKGIWLSPESGIAPIFTLFGSTNLNSRSANLDTELSFLMVIPESENNAELRLMLAREVDGLRQHALPWRGQERKVRMSTKLLVGLVEGML